MNAVFTSAPPQASLSGSLQKVCIGCGCGEATLYKHAPDRFHARSQRYELLRCPSCSLVWIEDPPTPEEMSQHYGPDYDEFIRKATEGDAAKHWQGPLATVLRHCQSGKLLDLGCGAGSFLNSIRGTPWELYGVELSGTAAQRAREKTGADVFTGDILDAPFAPARFDVVTCFHVFEHLYSPDEVLQKVWTWLKPGGIFCVHVPNIESAEARCFGSYWYGLELPRHLFHFSPDSLRQLARSTAFHEVELATRRTSFVEYSTRYLVDDIMGAAGVRRKSLAVSTPPSMTWRILRKCLRLTLLPLASSIISVKGEGEVLEAVFSKPA